MAVKKGKFFVIEGVDGSGKATHSKLLAEYLRSQGYDVQKIDFPQYGTKSAGLVENYLGGVYGSSEDVGPYRGSIFFSVDRYDMGFKIKQWLDEGKIVISDRYTASNIGHQGGKLISNKEEWAKYIDWLHHLEYSLFGIPKPDYTFILKISPELSMQMSNKITDAEKQQKRNAYLGDHQKQDIHEADRNHLANSVKSYEAIAERFPEEYKIITCEENGIFLPIETIQKKLQVFIEEKMASEEDPIKKIIDLETERQQNSLQMIPSENHSSVAVREALGSILTDKYAEGYPGKRYYGGNQFIDMAENLCIERAKALFGVEHVNVQPHSGSPANFAVYIACANMGDTIMGMALPMGGHLTHGAKPSFSGKFFNAVQYGLDPNTHVINYEEVEKLAKEHKPKLIWVGGSAYPRAFDFKKMGEIADSVGAYLAADIAHIAGLVAGGAHVSPVPYVHIVTTTTHKTLRGPRGGMIMVTRKGIDKDPELPKKIDKAVFPGLQGGPHENAIAAIAVCLKEASTPEFKNYADQVVKNTKALAEELKNYGFNLISGGTDNHLILIDLRNKNVAGAEAQDLLEAVGISTNKNSIPYDPAGPFTPSGLRLGTPAITTRGMKELEMKMIARWINEVISKTSSPQKIGEEIKDFTKKFPLPH